jgi:hypothetical protein
MRAWLWVLVVAGCAETVDEDADGFPVEEDCDDTDAAVFPGAAETPADGVDQDCDDAEDCFVDADEDGFGVDAVVDGPLTCDGAGVAAVADDCDDTDAAEFPGQLWYVDDDQDRFGDPNVTPNACERAFEDDTLDHTDCDDQDPDENPDRTWYADADEDGYGDAASPSACERAAETDVEDDTDCDDGDPDENPGAIWHFDVDQDGFGDASTGSLCERAAATDVLDDTDCDDDDADENPDATWYADVDGDGFGDASAASTCERAAETDVSDSTDCDDSDEDEHPGAVWYADADGDGYGDANVASSCMRGAETDVEAPTDCDDDAEAVHPGAVERCDFIDNDCDVATSEDGLAGYLTDSGSFTDLTATLGAGTATSPVSFTTSAQNGKLMLCSGTFYASLLFNANIELVGAGRDNTTLHGGGLVRPIARGHQNQVHTIRDLTIAGGYAADKGGSLYFSSNNEVLVERVNIRDTRAPSGSAIHNDSSVITLREVAITGFNNLGTNGGAIRMEVASPYPAPQMVLQDVTVSGDQTAGGTHAILVNAGILTAVRTTLSSTRPEVSAGGTTYERVGEMSFGCTNTACAP